MATATEALGTATAELRATNTALQALMTQVTVQLGAKTNAAQTVINQLLTAGVINYFIDPSGQLGGDDNANNGLAPDKPVRTLEKALDLIQAAGNSIFGSVIFSLSDGARLTRHRQISGPLSIVGAAWGGGPNGGLYRLVRRTFTYEPVALNSPVAGVGSTTPCLSSVASSIRKTSLGILLPDTSGLTAAVLTNMINGGTVVLDQCNIETASAGTQAVLFGASGPTTFSLSSTYGANTPGKLFLGVAAGQNPNTANFNYRSSLLTG